MSGITASFPGDFSSFVTFTLAGFRHIEGDAELVVRSFEVLVGLEGEDKRVSNVVSVKNGLDITKIVENRSIFV